MTGPPALEARGVVKRYDDVVALNGVDLDIDHGECLALVGESGSGKTTLLRMFNRTADPDAGEVRVGGRPARELDPVKLRRETGYVQQEGGLLPHWTVGRNAALVPWLQGRPDAAERGRAALERVGLQAARFADRWPRELSGGQRQRVALARALAGDPGVVLLDEPFGALDAITRAELQEAFGALVADLGITAVLVTHDLHEATRLADRVAVLRSGEIDQVAEPAVLLAAPATDYVRRLLAQARIGS
ncbi:MAG TPA: ATP-binding cassette domain-containing protein [Longimicrobiales bacterium]